jgi:hypothetical protein
MQNHKNLFHIYLWCLHSGTPNTHFPNANGGTSGKNHNTPLSDGVYVVVVVAQLQSPLLLDHHSHLPEIHSVL